RKGKLGPGDMIALDLKSGTLLASADIDQLLKSRHPYKSWLKQGVRYLESDLVDARLAAEPMDRDTLALYQKMFNVTQEERDEIIRVLAEVTHEFIDLQYDPAEGLRPAILRMCAQAESAVLEGKLVLLLSDRYLVRGRIPAHALLVTGAVHQHLVRTGLRCKCNLL